MTRYDPPEIIQLRIEEVPSYRKAYLRGWRASQRGSSTALEAADTRGEPDAWYHGYLDYAAGREKWHLPRCMDHGNC